MFNAFVNPGTIEAFWLKRASAPLVRNATVEWEFMVDGAHETVRVVEFEAHDVIAFTWSDGIAVSIRLATHEGHGTTVAVVASGFQGADASAQAVNATEGFTIVLCDLKSLLETGRSGNMVRDKAVLISAAKPPQG